MLTSWSTPREITIRGVPCTMLTWQVGYCDLAVYILRDEPRVMVGGANSELREADMVEIEALAERFDSAELRAAAARMKQK